MSAKRNRFRRRDFLKAGALAPLAWVAGAAAQKNPAHGEAGAHGAVHGDTPNPATGHAMAQSWGVPEYKFLALPHPIANLSEAELDARARSIAGDVAQLLLRGQES